MTGSLTRLACPPRLPETGHPFRHGDGRADGTCTGTGLRRRPARRRCRRSAGSRSCRPSPPGSRCRRRSSPRGRPARRRRCPSRRRGLPRRPAPSGRARRCCPARRIRHRRGGYAAEADRYGGRPAPGPADPDPDLVRRVGQRSDGLAAWLRRRPRRCSTRARSREAVPGREAVARVAVHRPRRRRVSCRSGEEPDTFTSWSQLRHFRSMWVHDRGRCGYGRLSTNSGGDP